MSLFYNPQKSGRGVSKESAQNPEMKPFFKFFELFGRKFWYLTQLNLLYILLCVPIITIGPATAAMTHVMRKFVLEEPIFVFEEFFKAFKKHFKRTVLVGLFSLVFMLASVVSLIYYNEVVLEYPDMGSYFMMGMNMLACTVFLTMNTYIYPQIICLDLSMNSIFKNSAKLCLIGFKRNVVTVLLFVAVVITMVFFFPFSLIALPIAPFSWLAFLGVFNAYPVIQKYIINPFYEKTGEANPEAHDFVTEIIDEETGKRSSLFTDLGGKETPIDKKSVKTKGKIIK
jgi:uncharacterized membrane protein YesL